MVLVCVELVSGETKCLESPQSVAGACGNERGCLPAKWVGLLGQQCERSVNVLRKHEASAYPDRGSWIAPAGSKVWRTHRVLEVGRKIFKYRSTLVLVNLLRDGVE